MISGIITAALLLSFLGIAAWAYSARNRERFADAASLPLTDETPAGRPSSLARVAGERRTARGRRRWGEGDDVPLGVESACCPPARQGERS
ncbi:cbb3-type cytochrome oxidase subunit 3 [Solimonas soli]|uniref:cbb3-type cytochrome oxidase subunit 3 n=1 Tax=Solimonas soli TaxID=413479 RepID=UPI000687ECD4|nr:cbb3-type cytochrome c oxidase subunit 3 [Solimonas soli]